LQQIENANELLHKQLDKTKEILEVEMEEHLKIKQEYERTRQSNDQIKEDIIDLQVIGPNKILYTIF
jgi:hypothetical protein